ncbi:MAG: YihY/virulence factor BrkB family protein [Verrucomicrobia bacterium]|nr:YihY/virulence factor BrkB family protein [Verrucomicrobiota bacterium]
MVTHLKQGWNRLKNFLLHGVWDADLSALPAGRSLPIRIVRIAQLIVKGFAEDDLAIHASALTFVTLMSLVPMLAVAFALLKGFGFGQERINQMLDWVNGMPPEFQSFVDTMRDIADATNFAAMGWVGLAFVLFTAVLVLASVEISFNRIWGVRVRRTVMRQVTNYISILVLVPLLIAFIGTAQASLRGGLLKLPRPISIFSGGLLSLASILTTWLTFWFIYVHIPNTKVKTVPALISSFLGAALWLAWQKAYISLQVGVARYNAIYGTFASVPIFLAWLYTSWVIILLGAELTFALQNSATYQIERAAENASSNARLIIGLTVLWRAAQALAGQAARFETAIFAREQRVPVRLLNEIVRLLVRTGFLAETSDKPGSFVLLRAADSIPIKEVVDIVMQEGARPEALGLAHRNPVIEKILAQLDSGVNRGLENLTIQQLLVPAP